MNNFVHTYKGAVGSISDLCLTGDGQFMISTSLDRYVRIHETNKCQLVYQCYLKSKPTHVAMVEEMSKDVPQEAQSSSQMSDNIPPRLAVDKEYEEMFSNMQQIW